MKKLLLPFAVLGISALVCSCNSQSEKPEAAADTFNLDSVRAEIAASNATFGSGFATGDSALFVSHYSSDACISPGNMPKICGTAGINAYFNGGYKMGIRGIKITTDELFGSKESVTETGTYEIFADKNVSIDKGKFMVFWKQENGKWKMHRDIWNSDLPAPSK